MPAKRPQRSKAPLQGILLLLLAALIALAFATHNAARPACGPLADSVADWLIAGLGGITAWVGWAILLPLGIAWILGRSKRRVVARALPVLLLASIVTILLTPLYLVRSSLGEWVFDWFRFTLGPWGSWIVLIAATTVAIWLVWRFTLPASWRSRVSEIEAPQIRLPNLRPKREPKPEPSREEERPVKRETPLKLVDSPPKIAGEKEKPSKQPTPRPDPEPAIQEKKIRSTPRTAPIRPTAEGEWKLPDIELLEEIHGTRAAIDREEILETSRLLVQTLDDFGVRGKVGEVHPGPVVTRYEYEPAAGVRVSQIVSRSDDISLALRAESIRIVAPIPGKAAVGIEIPNRTQAMISLKELLLTDEFRQKKGPLTMILGRDIAGVPIVANLSTMPHLLVAGATGSGKSVCLNVLLLSLLYQRTPDEVRLLMIDPKRLELTPYDGIPSLVCPVITEPKQAERMLEWLCLEMERRYKLFQKCGVKGLDTYRKQAAEEEGMAQLPYIVVVVDELADLMTAPGSDIEGSVSRLAHMARAVGIHMIFATQRPSVDVLTGVVKANFPARISFHVASRIDSRTILDAGGAECLLGRGDMLFSPPGKSEPIRVHGAYCADKDAEHVADFLREQPEAPDLIPDEDEEGAIASPARQDEMFTEALRVVVRERQASVSFLQRRLSVGYARAARLMDLLEAAGVVSPYDGSKARDVMVDESYLEEMG